MVGNEADYRQFVEDIDGVGACIVIPVWNGGGTVKVVPITNSYEIPMEAKIQEIQTILDPTQNQGLGIGIAPIGHVVTVTAPEKLEITITADVSFKDLYSLVGLKSAIDQSLKDYILEVQKDWRNEDELTIYIARCIAAILLVNGVENVTNLKINGKEEDVTIEPRIGNNQYPVLGEVNINEID